MLVLLLFFCSGATALVYEVLWSKYLTLMLGSTVQAQTVVLAVFMGGLALGNRLFGVRATLFRQPLRTYAILELLIGGYAYLFPKFFRLGDYVFVKVGSAVVDTPLLPLVLKLALSVLLLLGPTILMGGTLPLLAAWIQRRPGWEPRQRVGIFYAINSLGAVLGAGLSAFYLIETFGLMLTAELTAMANILVGFCAGVLAKKESLQLTAPVATAAEPASTSPVSMSPLGIPLGLLVAITGGVSMGLEVLFSRALALIAGGSLQSFALVLMSFILGIGLGSMALCSSRVVKERAAGTIYLLLFSAACLVLVHVLMIEKWALTYANAKFGLAPNHVGFVWHQLAVGLLAFIFLGLPAAFLGAVVPLAIRLGNAGQALGDQVGRLLTWNTLGAVAGTLLTGFLLMPWLGLRAALATLGIGLIAAAGWVAYRRQETPVLLLAVILAAGALVGVISTGEKWRLVMSAGIFRVRNLYLTPDSLDQRKKEVELVYYKDSADATVCVEKGPLSTNGYQLTLRLNGKSDASSVGDAGTQLLLAHIPLTARPDATNVFVLGFGSGITAGALLGHPIQQVTIAENSRPVLEAGTLFEHWNRGVLTNSRTRIFNDDARSVLKLHPDKYDVIVSEPSNPWVAGIGSVFTQDFYELCASRLRNGGVMAQWFHKYEMGDDIVFMVFRTFASVFPFMEIWEPQQGDLILLGSQKPWLSNPARYQVIFDREQPGKDLRDLRIATPAALWARQLASQKTAAAIAGDGPIQTDELPLLEYAAPEAFFVGAQANHLFLFDERTLQFPLCDRSKIAVLRALPKETLLASFSLFTTTNPDMRAYLDAIAPGPNPPRLDPMGQIVFRSPESYQPKNLSGSRARTELIECLQAEAGLLKDDEHWLGYAQRIEQALLSLIAQNTLQPRDMVPEYFAGLAVRFAIGHEDYLTALRILRIGFVFSQQDEDLSYLSRVLDRIVPPEVLEQAKQRADGRSPAPATPSAH